MQEKIQLIHYY